MKVINQTLQPIVLEEGSVLGAAGTEGSVRPDVNLSESDRRRYVATGQIAVIEISSTEPATAPISEPVAAESRKKKGE